MPTPFSHEIANTHLRLGNNALLSILGLYSIGQRQEAFASIIKNSGKVYNKKFLNAVDVCQNRHVSIVTVLDEDYPLPLRFLQSEAPPILYVQGNYDLLKTPGVAIIGSRAAGKFGKSATIAWSRALSEYGWTICSGNANGIDSSAHRNTLLCNGRTIFFSYSSPESFNPTFRNPSLSDNNYLVISPFPPTSIVNKGTFLQRNKLLAALTKGALVMETGIRGGTLDTVKKFRSTQKPIFITDMPPDSPRYDAHRALSSSVTGQIPLLPDHQSLLDVVDSLNSSIKQSSIVVPLIEDLFEGAL